jgi:hypothetical protein
MEVSPFLHIAEDGTVTVYAGKNGPGTECSHVTGASGCRGVASSDASMKVLVGGYRFGSLRRRDFGSRSTPDMALRLHRVAAVAREALIDMAADHFKVDRGTLTRCGWKNHKKRRERSDHFWAAHQGTKAC